MKQTILYVFTIAALVLCSAGSVSAQHGQYVGGDISLLPSYEASNTVYLDASGNKITDLIPWLKSECGWNCFRVRLFVNPQKKANDGKTFDPAVCQDLEYVKALGKRIKDAGAQFLLDIHYSDTYVDATHIQSPAAWNGLSVAQKAEKMYSYTKETLESLKAAGACPDLVQVGNEIMYGLCDVKVHPYESAGDNWDGFLSLVSNGCKAVREVCPDASIILHTDRPGNMQYNRFWYGKMVEAKVDFDVIGLSYYPFWHGYLTVGQDSKNNLSNALKQLKTDFPDKKVQIVETAYNFQYWPTSGVNYNTQSTWACSADGQHKFVNELIEELAKHDNVEGLSYWCPEEAGSGDAANWNTNEGVVVSSWLNRGLWWSTSSNGHWPLTSGGKMTVSLFKDFLSEEAAGIATVADEKPASNATYNIAGQRVSNNKKGLVIQNGRKIYKR